MELPVSIEPYSIHVQIPYKINITNLSYKLGTTKNTNNYVLRNVTCEAKPGDLTVIAGPSGAGKTTLLQILSGSISPRHLSGQILINNKPINTAHFRRASGYVTQDEALFPHLTVEETLTYSARLRLRGPPEISSSRVRYLLKELGLEHIASARVGSESNRGISGGEKRRVSIGVELVHDPSVLLLDEPTSGLDSASALHVMLLLKSMTKNQFKTVVLTIHQPGFRILDLIDKVILLSNGKVLHHGSLSLLEERIKSAGHCIPARVNVLEYAIDSLGSCLGKDMEFFELEHEAADTKHIAARAEEQVLYSNSRSKEVLILTQRFSKNIFRTKQLFAAKTTESVLAGIILGTIFPSAFGDGSSHRVSKMQNQLGFLAFSLTFLMSTTIEALPIFLRERRIVMREVSRGVYRVSSYVAANALVFLPFLLIVALLYAIPVYWLVGLRREIGAFLFFCLVIWMVVLMANSFVACFSTLVPNYIMGMSVIYGVMGSFFLFSGYFVSRDTVPKYWSFMQYLSLFKYPFECFMINEYGGERGKLRCLEGGEGECFMYGNQFLMQQGLKESQKWTNLIVMLSFIVGYRFLGLVFLWCRSCRSRI